MINEDDEDFVVVSDKRPGGLSRAGLKRPHEEDNYAPADSPKECILSSKKTENMDIKSSIIAIVAEKDLEDDSNCPICLDRWTSSGEHRVASLRCGHLFGKHCIWNWLGLASKNYCPQCKAQASQKDIIPLHVTRLVALDTHERDQLMQRAIFEKSERARILSQCANLQAQLDASLKDNEILRQQIFDLSNGVQPMTKFVSPIDFKLFRTVSFGSASTCKCIEYSKSHNMYIVGYSRPFPSSLNLSKGDQSIQYGIAKVSLLDDQIIEFLPIHTDHVKAISHCSYSKDFGDSIISTGFDRTLKMTSLATNTVQLEYSLSAQGWSCVFDPIDTNIIYVGLGNGTLCIFDVHRPRDGPIRIINAFSRDGKSIPIHSITVIPEKNGDGKNLILANPMGPFFIYLDSDKCPQRVLYPDDSNIKGDCFALTVDPVTLNFIFLNRSQGAHIFGKLAIPENESNVFIIKVEKTISCERRSGSISHSTMYHVNQKVILAIPDTDYPRLKLLTVPDFVEIEAESTRLPIYGKANAMIFGKSPSSPNGINLGVLFDQTLSIFQ